MITTAQLYSIRVLRFCLELFLEYQGFASSAYGSSSQISKLDSWARYFFLGLRDDYSIRNWRSRVEDLLFKYCCWGWCQFEILVIDCFWWYGSWKHSAVIWNYFWSGYYRLGDLLLLPSVWRFSAHSAHVFKKYRILFLILSETSS